MRKLLKSRKALSPVVAAIILIAVTVAVSIAVAAWMGALTFTFMATEELKITRVSFPTSTTISVVVNNTGTSKVTVKEALVNNVKETMSSATINPGQGAQITITLASAWVAGTKYEVALITANGNRFSYTATAPL